MTIRDTVGHFVIRARSGSGNVIIPEHQSKQARQPHQMSKRGQVRLSGIYLDHKLRHRRHPSIPVYVIEINCFLSCRYFEMQNCVIMYKPGSQVTLMLSQLS